MNVEWIVTPFLVLAGIIIKGVYDHISARMTNRVNTKQVQISETDASTRQFQAIVEGFTQSMAVISDRATTAEAAAKQANQRAEALESRVTNLEREREELIRYALKLEGLVPTPPGPPPRPTWLLI